jgi:hypothetical protein
MRRRNKTPVHTAGTAGRGKRKAGPLWEGERFRGYPA